MDTRTSLPDRFPAGTTVKYTRSYGDFRASDSWTLSLVLAGAVKKTFAATTNADGQSFDFVLPFHDAGGPDATDELTPGVYTAAEYASKGSERFLVGGPWTIQILPDLVAATGNSAQLYLEKLKSALELSVSGNLQPGSELARIEVEGRAVEMIPLERRFELLDIVNARLARLLNSGAIAVPVEVHFE